MNTIVLPRRCRICGCTDRQPCFDPARGLACYWWEPTLCSTCGPLEAMPPPQLQAMLSLWWLG